MLLLQVRFSGPAYARAGGLRIRGRRLVEFSGFRAWAVRKSGLTQKGP